MNLKRVEATIIEREKFRAVSDTVRVCLKAVITENTIEEKCIDKNCSNDDYKLHCSCVAFYLQIDFLKISTIYYIYQ